MRQSQNHCFPQDALRRGSIEAHGKSFTEIVDVHSLYLLYFVCFICLVGTLISKTLFPRGPMDSEIQTIRSCAGNSSEDFTNWNRYESLRLELLASLLIYALESLQNKQLNTYLKIAIDNFHGNRYY